MTQGASFFSAVSNAPWDDVLPLAQVLEVPLAPESATVTPEHSAALWKKLSYLGSNDLAYLLRGFEGVDYPEIVRDVCKRLKVSGAEPGEDERTVELNEQRLVASLFARAWADVDDDQRRELLRELNLDEGHLPLAGADVAAAVLSGKAGPFVEYKLSRLMARSVAGVLPPRRLSPARRRTVQAVVLVASLRQAQRTALAATALVSTGEGAESLTVSAAQPKQARRGASRKTAERPPERPEGAKKKAVRKKAATRKKVAKKGTKNEAAKKVVTKKRTASKTAAKKKAAKKTAAKKTAAKKTAARKKATKPAPTAPS